MAARENLISIITVIAVFGKIYLIVNIRMSILGTGDFSMEMAKNCPFKFDNWCEGLCPCVFRCEGRKILCEDIRRSIS